MKKEGRARKLFPGGNTSVGFYSFFRYIIDEKTANQIYYIKGGPGVGKSYMMNKIGIELLEKGYDVEFHHCTADPDSIDAIFIPQKKVAMIDGTAPHANDPTYPGITGKTVNLGEFLYTKELDINREKIIEAINDNKNIYGRIYRFLSAAKQIHDDIEWIYSNATNFNGVNKETEWLIREYLQNFKYKGIQGKVRHLFGSAYTLKGHIDYGETVFGKVGKRIYIKGAPGSGKSTMLETFLKHAIMEGLDVEAFHEPLVPEKLESIIIPQLDLCFTTNIKYIDKKIIDLDIYIDKNKIKKYENELKNSEKVFSKLLNDVFENLSRTKEVHDEIEKFYSGSILIEGLDVIRDNILNEILEIIE